MRLFAVFWSPQHSYFVRQSYITEDTSCHVTSSVTIPLQMVLTWFWLALSVADDFRPNSNKQHSAHFVSGYMFLLNNSPKTVEQITSLHSEH